MELAIKCLEEQCLRPIETQTEIGMMTEEERSRICANFLKEGAKAKAKWEEFDSGKLKREIIQVSGQGLSFVKLLAALNLRSTIMRVKDWKCALLHCISAQTAPALQRLI